MMEVGSPLPVLVSLRRPSQDQSEPINVAMPSTKKLGLGHATYNLPSTRRPFEELLTALRKVIPQCEKAQTAVARVRDLYKDCISNTGSVSSVPAGQRGKRDVWIWGTCLSVTCAQGADMMKHGRQGKPKMHYFRVADNDMQLTWRSAKGSQRSVALRNVRRVRPSLA